MLRGIPDILSPELLNTLAEMGHGVKLVIADMYYPSAANARRAGGQLIRADGVKSVELLDAILRFFPLDRSVDKPVTIIGLQDCDKGKVETPVWEEYIATVEKYDERGRDAVGWAERFDFYALADTAYAVVATSETALYGCLVIQKGTK